MTAEGWPETDDEIQDVLASRDWQLDVLELRGSRTRGDGNLEEVMIAEMRERYGPGLVDSLLEWLES